ncbi:MAG: SDR family oxidoreductase, partial [Planctomycetota bacterium]
MGLMTGKKGIVFGVANERSYAYFIAKSLVEQGAEVGFTYLPMGKMEHRVKKAVQKLGIDEPWLVECDANDDASLDNVFAQWEKDHGTLDFVV